MGGGGVGGVGAVTTLTKYHDLLQHRPTKVGIKDTKQNVAEKAQISDIIINY